MIKENIAVISYDPKPIVTYDIRCKLLEWATIRRNVIIASRIEAQGYNWIDNDPLGTGDNIYMYVEIELACLYPFCSLDLLNTFKDTANFDHHDSSEELLELLSEVPEIAEVTLTKNSSLDKEYYTYFTSETTHIQAYPARIRFQPYGIPKNLRAYQLLEDKPDLQDFNSIDIYRHWLPDPKQNSIDYENNN